jgi:hypothetical protein
MFLALIDEEKNGQRDVVPKVWCHLFIGRNKTLHRQPSV